MYLKLTRLDNSPIWLNAAFIVTIEPRKQGGSIVVPIGDGLDYEVREPAESVLAMLDGAPVASVVPVPPPKEFAKKPEEVATVEPNSPQNEQQGYVSDSEKERSSSATSDEKPKKKTVRKTTTRKTKTKKETPVVKPPPLDDDQVGRLSKMMPGNVKKLANTLITQFKVSDVQAVLDFLSERKLAAVDGTRIVWTSVPATAQ